MSLPDWNTYSAFLTDRTATFATSPELTIDGSYRFYATAHPDNIERLALAVDVSRSRAFDHARLAHERRLHSVMTSCSKLWDG